MSATESTPANNGDRAAFRSFLTAFVASSVLLLAAISAMNVVVDPHGAWQTKLLPGGYDGAGSRIGKGELLHRYRGSTVLLGNSRTKIGVRPDGPGIPSAPACNLGFPGAVARELWMAVDRSAEQPSVRSILLFVDFTMFVDIFLKADFTMSRFQAERSGFDHGCDLLFNGRTLGYSCEQLTRILTGEPPEYTPEGFSIPERLPLRAVGQRDRTIKMLNQAMTVGGHFERLHYAPATVEPLRAVIRRCRERSVQLTVSINPAHATMFEGVFQWNLWDDYERWMRDLTRVIDEESQGQVVLWDFTGFHAYTTEPLLSEAAAETAKWFWEPSHYKAEMGDRMLERIYDLPSADPNLGVRLTNANVDARLKEIAADRQRWLTSQATEARWVTELVRSAQGHSATKLAVGVGSETERR